MNQQHVDSSISYSLKKKKNLAPVKTVCHTVLSTRPNILWTKELIDCGSQNVLHFTIESSGRCTSIVWIVSKHRRGSVCCREHWIHWLLYMGPFVTHQKEGWAYLSAFSAPVEIQPQNDMDRLYYTLFMGQTRSTTNSPPTRSRCQTPNSMAGGTGLTPQRAVSSTSCYSEAQSPHTHTPEITVKFPSKSNRIGRKWTKENAN